MKKNISFIPMDSILAGWLLDKLKNQSPDSIYTKDLMNGIQEFMDGETVTLILGASENMNFIPIPETADDGLIKGELSIYPKSRKVLMGKNEVNLTPKEFDILFFLAQNQGQVFTKEQIYRAVWEEDFLLADSNIMAFIRKLRKKIEPNPDSPEYILTIWGIGYKFNDNI